MPTDPITHVPYWDGEAWSCLFEGCAWIVLDSEDWEVQAERHSRLRTWVAASGKVIREEEIARPES